MLSYHADADINTNPYELGLDRLINLDMEAAFVGKEALQRIRATGVSRKQVGLRIEGGPMAGPNTTFWPLSKAEHMVGHVTVCRPLPASVTEHCARYGRPWITLRLALCWTLGRRLGRYQRRLSKNLFMIPKRKLLLHLEPNKPWPTKAPVTRSEADSLGGLF